MNYQIEYTDKSREDIIKIKRSGNSSLYKKLCSMLHEIQEHPRSGRGQIEHLKHFKEETWSRRINREHRIVYEIHDNIITVTILSVLGHYK